MKVNRPFKILGMGYYLPSEVDSFDIEKKHGIPFGWSEKYSGVKIRHYITHESNGYMGARAAEIALKKSNLRLEEIDMLISAGGTYDYPLPNQASI
ncbi:MAG: beta-ketoacyl-ACP synthase III, partial [Bacteroidetes bacterium]|nr:beta-ketoacyl-ACP synthase III [Bacteroidota bacterium]